ncbi:hypothetical protein Tco_1188111 [Tanacetum coccineum]
MSLRKLGYNVIASLAVLLIGLGGLEFFEFVHDTQHVCSRHHLPISIIMKSHSLQRLAITSFRLSPDVSDAGLPSEKVVASGKNGDDGDLLLFRDGPGACDISVIGLLERSTSQVLLGWSVPWRLPALGSCQARCWKAIETFLEHTLHMTEWSF